MKWLNWRTNSLRTESLSWDCCWAEGADRGKLELLVILLCPCWVTWMIKFLVPSRLSLCFQNEIELSFRKLKSYKYHLHDYVKFDRNRINLYPFLLHVIITLTLDILCRSSQEKPTFFIFLLMLLLSLNPHKKTNWIIKLFSYSK